MHSFSATSSVFRSRIFFSMLALSIALSGCAKKESGSELSTAELQQKIATLEAENQALKAKEADSSSTSTALVMTPSASTLSTKTFSDLNDVATKPILDDLIKLHIFDELGSEFKPYQPITRGEFVTWLFKAYNAQKPASDQLRPAPQLAPQFKDLAASHPAYPYAQALANAGFSVGYDDGTFKADQPLTREELIAIKVGVDMGKNMRPDASQMAYESGFSDSKQVDNRYTGYILSDLHISGKFGSNIQRAFGKIGTFRPKQAVLRHEAAATFWQFNQFGTYENAEIQINKLLGKKDA